MSNEFEDREKQGLGELVEDILEERGELFKPENGFSPPSQTSIGTPRPAGLPPDVRTETRVKDLPGRIGVMPRKVHVTSTYDARLVNGRDFLHTDLVTETVDIYGTGTMVISTQYQVKEGYVGVLRGFFFEFQNPIAGLELDDTTTRLTADSVTIPNYSDLSLGQITQKFVPIFAIAKNGGTFGLTISIPHSIPFDAGLSTLEVYFQFYGNELLAKGLPPEFEIANVLG